MLENCPNITSVNFSGCDGYTRDSRGDRDEKVSEGIYGMLFCECSFVFGVPVPTLCWNFLAASLALNFLLFEQRTRRITRLNQSRHLRRPLRSGNARFQGHEIRVRRVRDRQVQEEWEAPHQNQGRAERYPELDRSARVRGCTPECPGPAWLQ